MSIELNVIFAIALIIVICLLTLVARKIKVAYPILLVLAGLGISFLPIVPKIQIAPELIFIIFLPPLLFEAATSVSWKELYRWRRIITSFAFLVVFITACAVAIVANKIIPGFSIALGFLLGGIVSPPDAVSAQAIMKFVKVPKRIASVIEGESLFNDASSLIIMKFALIAVGTGQFVWYEAAGSFVWMILGGVGVGAAIAWLIVKLHSWLPVDVQIEVVFTLIAPYIMYLVAEEVEASGVIAVVSGGLVMSNHPSFSDDSSTRLSASSVWGNLGFLLNGIVFLLIGLDLPEIVSTIQADGISIASATWYGVLITAVLIVVRLLCSFGAMLTTVVMGKVITVADPNYYGMRGPVILGWTGMRGVVSLAAALSIPLTITSQGWPFPERSMIIYITFVVILLTLVIQGLTLPIIIRHTTFPDFHDHLPVGETEELIRKGMAQTSLDYLNEHRNKVKACDGGMLTGMIRHWEEQTSNSDALPYYQNVGDIYVEILERQRQYLYRLNRERADIDEDIIRRFVHRIDLEEERIKNE